MPAGAAALRAEESATLERLVHERFTSDEIGRLLDELRPYEESLDPDSDEASLIRVTRRDWEKARKVPAELQGEIAHAAARGAAGLGRGAQELRLQVVPAPPRAQRRAQAPLRRVLRRRALRHPAGRLRGGDEDVRGRGGLRRAQARARRRSSTEAAANPVDDSFLKTTFEIDKQRELNTLVLEHFGWDGIHWRLDEIVHPAAYSLGTTDIRITTRYAEDGLESLFSTMHEFGHGLYERQVDPALERRRSCNGVSLGLHESQ